MSSTTNLSLMAPPEIIDPSPTPAKLKPLSLVTNNRSSFDIDRNDGAGPSTPRRTRHPGMRSSISYSPALAGGITRKEGYLGREEGVGFGVGGGGIKEESPVRERGGDVGEKRKRKTQTLAEKHSDLLTLIAQRERRVSELRQELAHQEATLDSLKTRWTNIVSRSSSIPTPHHPTSTSSTSHTISSDPSSTSVSASSSTSSLAPAFIMDDNPDQTPTLAGLLQSALGPSEEAIEGGKRFWGQLVKTVSAAAGGTVPMPDHDTVTNHARDEGQAESLVQKLDLAGLKTMLPAWTGVSLTSPPLPANASRLPGRKIREVSASGSTSSISSDTGSLISLLDVDDAEERIDGRGIMTPKKGGGGVQRKVVVRSVSEGDERGGGEIAEGWGNW